MSDTSKMSQAEWEFEYTKLNKLCDRQSEIIKKQNGLLLLAYNSGHREGWENGRSVAEVMEELHSYLCEIGLLK